MQESRLNFLLQRVVISLAPVKLVPHARKGMYGRTAMAQTSHTGVVEGRRWSKVTPHSDNCRRPLQLPVPARGLGVPRRA